MMEAPSHYHNLKSVIQISKSFGNILRLGIVLMQENRISRRNRNHMSDKLKYKFVVPNRERIHYKDSFERTGPK